MLAKDVKKLHKAWSVWVAAAIPVIAVLADVLPELKTILPASWYAYVAVGAIVARALNQAGFDDNDKPSE